MKKCFILLLILCLLLAGCARQQTSLITTLKFYYPLQVADYTLGASYIQPELREGAGVDKSLKNMLNLYLKGPKDQITFQMPFRYNTQVVSIFRSSTMLDITLNRGFANYTGLDLTIACACITMTSTVFEPASAKALRTFSIISTQISSACRKLNCRKVKSIWICLAIISFGTMP